MSYSVSQRIDVRGKFSFVKCVEPFFPIMECVLAREGLVHFFLEAEMEIAGLPCLWLWVFTYKCIQMPVYNRRTLQTWAIPDQCQEEGNYLGESKSLQISLTQVGYIPYYVLSDVFFPLALKHRGHFAWVKFVSFAGKAFPFHMVRIANLVVSEVANIIVWYHRM